jgi:hypothetical protein
MAVAALAMSVGACAGKVGKCQLTTAAEPEDLKQDIQPRHHTEVRPGCIFPIVKR